VASILGSIFGKPTPPWLSKRLAQCIFADETALLELIFECPKHLHLRWVLPALGKAARQRHDETRAILQITKCRLGWILWLPATWTQVCETRIAQGRDLP